MISQSKSITDSKLFLSVTWEISPGTRTKKEYGHRINEDTNALCISPLFLFSLAFIGIYLERKWIGKEIKCISSGSLHSLYYNVSNNEGKNNGWESNMNNHKPFIYGFILTSHLSPKPPSVASDTVVETTRCLQLDGFWQKFPALPNILYGPGQVNGLCLSFPIYKKEWIIYHKTDARIKELMIRKIAKISVLCNYGAFSYLICNSLRATTVLCILPVRELRLSKV